MNTKNIFLYFLIFSEFFLYSSQANRYPWQGIHEPIQVSLETGRRCTKPGTQCIPLNLQQYPSDMLPRVVRDLNQEGLLTVALHIDLREQKSYFLIPTEMAARTMIRRALPEKIVWEMIIINPEIKVDDPLW